MQKRIDINSDLGEGMDHDAQIMPFISSANIACGYHAGDADTIKATIGLCLQHNVHIGAHPSFDDKENFGRREISLPDHELYELVTKQIQILDEASTSAGGVLHHVKPHGALYNMAARNKNIAAVIAAAVHDYNDKLILVGLSNSFLIEEAKKRGLSAYHEAFADRTYQDDGQLTSRSQQNALIQNDGEAVQQVMQMINDHTVTSVNGKRISITADTICIHGDGSHVLRFVLSIYDELLNAGFQLNKSNRK